MESLKGSRSLESWKGYKGLLPKRPSLARRCRGYEGLLFKRPGLATFGSDFLANIESATKSGGTKDYFLSTPSLSLTARARILVIYRFNFGTLLTMK